MRTSGDFVIQFDGEALPAMAGETIAAALVANGRRATCVDPTGAPRGPYCGMGVCHDCLVVVDGRHGERACLTSARPNQRVESRRTFRVPLGADAADLAELPDKDPPVEACDVVVVGSGPGGLAAARAAAENGLSVVVLDERPSPGGQFYKQPSTSRSLARADRQARQGRAQIETARALGVRFAAATHVWGGRNEQGQLELFAIGPQGARNYRPRMAIVATGAYESPALFPGWTLPSVMTAGAAQTLARAYGVVPGQRVMVAGNGALNAQVAFELLRLGVRVTLVEAAPPPWTRPRACAALGTADARLAAKGVYLIGRLLAGGAEILWNRRVIAAEGDGHVTRVRLAIVGADPINLAERSQTREVDALVTGEGFRPADELPRLIGCRRKDGPVAALERDDDGATSAPDVFVVGEAGGFGGAQIARAQGTLSGLEAARRLGRSPATGNRERRALTRARAFQQALAEVFAAPPRRLADVPPETVLCRCQALTRANLDACVSLEGVKDLATLKRLTRAGMGRCQGRYCEATLRALYAFERQVGERGDFAPQAPLRPIPLAAIAVAKAEWRGHRRVALSAPTAQPGEPLGVAAVETLIVGAGVAGLSTALFLAREGREAIVVDAGWPNAGASGANAGSLHAQLLSFDFDAESGDDGGPAARTLPLQLESIRLWRELERELGGDFEIKLSGGLMLAENEADLVRLEQKARLERAYGVASVVIDRAALRALEPALDERFCGAAFCPDEGKINPLIATHGLLRGAQAKGARVFPQTAVLSMERAANGFRVLTNRGEIRAARVVNAAGGYAADIGEMLGLSTPVHGAPLQMIVTEPAAPTLTCLVAHARRHLTLKQTANGGFLIGGGWPATLDATRRRPRATRASLEGNAWVAQDVLPALRKLHILRSWGAINIDIDGAPLLGEHPSAPGFFYAVTSNGYTLGPAVGRTTAELITKGRAERDISQFGVERFRALARTR